MDQEDVNALVAKGNSAMERTSTDQKDRALKAAFACLSAGTNEKTPWTKQILAQIDAALASAQAPARLSPPKWQTMESAPKNLKPILAGFQGQFKWMWFIADANGPDTKRDGYAAPTHWMKLPSPPTEGEKP